MKVLGSLFKPFMKGALYFALPTILFVLLSDGVCAEGKKTEQKSTPGSSRVTEESFFSYDDDFEWDEEFLDNSVNANEEVGKKQIDIGSIIPDESTTNIKENEIESSTQEHNDVQIKTLSRDVEQNIVKDTVEHLTKENKPSDTDSKKKEEQESKSSVQNKKNTDSDFIPELGAKYSNNSNMGDTPKPVLKESNFNQDEKAQEQQGNIGTLKEDNQIIEDVTLQKWSEVNKKPVEAWKYKQNRSMHKWEYDNLNEHLPVSVSIHDYHKQLFYCVKKGDLLCLRALISRLGNLDIALKEVLKFRNKFGDTPLIYAVKQGNLDIIRFLLLQGADPDEVNYDFQSSLDLAIKSERAEIINVIAEMVQNFLEQREINNKESSEMYNWAKNTKSTKCNAQ